MSRIAFRSSIMAGLGLAMVSFAPAPPRAVSKSTPLAEARYKAALKQYGEVWTYYRQSRSDSFRPYYWSRLLLDAEQDLNADKPGRIAAVEAHLERIKQLEALVKKVRKLGFGFSTDVGATEYFRIEAERWLEKTREE